MNLHTPSTLDASAQVNGPDANGRVWVFIGYAMLSMSISEARNLADSLQAVTDAAAPAEGIQVANADLVPAKHATMEGGSGE